MYNIYQNLFKFIEYRNFNKLDEILSEEEFETEIKTQNYVKIKCKEVDIILFEEDVVNKFISDILKKNKSEFVIIITKDVSIKVIPENVKNYFHRHFKIVIPNHVLVPKYKILNNEEKQEILEKYLICEGKELPIMLITDPMSIWLGCKPGQVLSETFEFENCGLVTNYVIIR